jgi:hypothetical protein
MERQARAQQRQPPPRSWRPSWEPEEGLRENEDVARMVDTWNEDKLIHRRV